MKNIHSLIAEILSSGTFIKVDERTFRFLPKRQRLSGREKREERKRDIREIERCDMRDGLDSSCIDIKNIKRYDRECERKKRETNMQWLRLFPKNYQDYIGFYGAWKNWLAFRTEKKCPVTKTTAISHMKLLSVRLTNNPKEAMEIINQSIERGWRGLFKMTRNGSTLSIKQRNICGDVVRHGSTHKIERNTVSKRLTNIHTHFSSGLKKIRKIDATGYEQNNIVAYCESIFKAWESLPRELRYFHSTPEKLAQKYIEFVALRTRGWDFNLGAIAPGTSSIWKKFISSMEKNTGFKAGRKVYECN